jgi:hypothetical protein
MSVSDVNSRRIGCLLLIASGVISVAIIKWLLGL